MIYQWIAAAPFGIEGITAKELRAMGLSVQAQQGGALFEGSAEDAFRANLWLRSADRVSLFLGKFPARSFEELFQGIYALSWEDILPENAVFPVNGKCVRAQLMSLPDCQAIAKKAIVKRLQTKYRRNIFAEDGPLYRVHIALIGEHCTVSLNASGEALNRRGYRLRHTEAPLRETLAAALLLSSPLRDEGAFADPMCGSGTFAVEAAMMRYGKAPGLDRKFDCEGWAFLDRSAWPSLREEARERFRQALEEERGPLLASDIDPGAVETAEESVRRAGFEGRIRVSQKDASAIELPMGRGLIVCNPPYGERLGDRAYAEEAAKTLGALLRANPEYLLCALTALPDFERHFGRRAFRRRRIYNGRIECEFLTWSMRENKTNKKKKR